MLRVLIIDDEPEKVRELATVVRSSGISPEPDILSAGDLYAARKAMSDVTFDLVLLDVNLPARAGDAPSPNACEGFLSDVGRERRVKRPISLIGITAFEELYDALNAVFAAHGWLLFSTTSHSATWPAVVTDRLKFLQKAAVCSENAKPQYELDVAIVAALATPELTAVLEWPARWTTTRPDDDFVEFQRGEIAAKGGSLQVVAASCQQMGLVAASTLALKMCRIFRPRLIVMVGIAAGVRGRVNIGDVLVADESWDYNSGKLAKTGTERVFAPDPKAIRILPETCEVFQNSNRNAKIISKAFDAWKGALPPKRPKIVIGPVASGSSVVADPDKVTEIAEHNRKLIGLEMETYGVYFAAANSWFPRPAYLSVKAVCDYADEKKADGFQGYAAHMSAMTLLEFMKEGVLPGPGT